MSNNKKLKKTKAQKNVYKYSGIINCKGIYVHTVKGKNGKRQHKRSCVYYDVDTELCKNNNCSKSVCTTAHNCTGYKRKEKKVIKSNLSSYDESYIQKPIKAGIHERNTFVSGMSRNIGTAVHEGFLKSDGKRRHKARCIYYDKVGKICSFVVSKCIGSSHCKNYREK